MYALFYTDIWPSLETFIFSLLALLSLSLDFCIFFWRPFYAHLSSLYLFLKPYRMLYNFDSESLPFIDLSVYLTRMSMTDLISPID